MHAQLFVKFIFDLKSWDQMPPRSSYITPSNLEREIERERVLYTNKLFQVYTIALYSGYVSERGMHVSLFAVYISQLAGWAARDSLQYSVKTYVTFATHFRSMPVDNTAEIPVQLR